MCKPITLLRLKYVSTTDLTWSSPQAIFGLMPAGLPADLTPEYRSQDGSGTAVYHRFEDRSIILSRTTLIEVYTLSLISVFRAQAWPLFTPGWSSASGTNRGLDQVQRLMCKPVTQLRLKYVSTTDLTPDHSSKLWFNARGAPRVIRAQGPKFRGWCVNLLHN